MVTSQQLVIGWFEYAVAGTALLLVTKLIVSRLRQPIDRQNLILMGLAASAFLPLVISLSSWPNWHLGLFATNGEQVAVAQVASSTKQPSPQQLPVLAIDESNIAKLTREQFNETYKINEQRHEQRPDTEQAGVIAEIPATSNTSLLPASSLFPASSTETTSANTFSVWWVAAVILFASHVLAFGFFIVQWNLGTIRLHIICRDAHPADAAVRETWTQISGKRGGSVRLLLSTQITAPLVFGFWRPVILIPESLAQGDRSALRYCLAHEWSHVIGGDLRAWHFTNFCQYLLWYQPLFWMLRRELRICQDLVADDRAVGTSSEVENRLQYSELLMSIAKQKLNPNIVGAIAFHDRSSQLSRRIKMLLSTSQSLRVRSPKAFLWLSACLLLVASLLVGSVRLNTANADAGSTPQPELAQDGDTTQSNDDQQQTEQAKEFKIVRGRVINEQGEPVPGAQLWLPLQFHPKRSVSATTDHTGRFELNIPLDWISSRVSGSLWTAWVYAPGYGIQSKSAYDSIQGTTDKEFTIQLPPEGSTRFKVTTPDGQPMADVLVQPRNYKTSAAFEIVPPEIQALVATRTNEEGVASLPSIQPELMSMLELVQEEYGRQLVRTDWADDVPLREIRLRSTASLKGRLVGENSDWVRGVKLIFETENRDQSQEPEGIAEVVTDDYGQFEVPLIATGGPLRTYVLLDQDLPVRPVLTNNLFLMSGDTLALEIPLVSAPIVHGKVISQSTGQAVANAEISLGYGGFRQSDRVTTNEDGYYQGRVLPGNVSIHIIYLPDGLMRLRENLEKRIAVPADVEAFELPTIEVVGSKTIFARLLGADDQPLADTQVIAVDGTRRLGFGRSDEDGYFQLSVPDGAKTQIEVDLKNGQTLPVEVIQSDPMVVRQMTDSRLTELDAERSLKADVVLTGRIVYASEPIANVSLILQRGVPIIRGDSEQTGMRFVQVAEGLSDADGNYRLSGLKAGDPYEIEIRPPFPAADYRWLHQPPFLPTLPDDATGEVQLPEVKLVDLTQSVAGVVVDLDGNPIQRARVSVRFRTGESLKNLSDSRSRPWTQSDQKGRFQLRELPDEPLSVFAYISDPKTRVIRFPVKFDIERNQQDIRIVLDPSLIEK